MELLLEVGVDAIGPSVMSLAGRIADGVESRGYRLMIPRTAETGSGIVSFQKDGTDSRLVVRNLKSAGVMAAPRQGWVRVSPHFYNRAEEVDRLLDVLP